MSAIVPVYLGYRPGGSSSAPGVFTYDDQAELVAAQPSPPDGSRAILTADGDGVTRMVYVASAGEWRAERIEIAATATAWDALVQAIVDESAGVPCVDGCEVRFGGLLGWYVGRPGAGGSWSADASVTDAPDQILMTPQVYVSDSFVLFGWSTGLEANASALSARGYTLTAGGAGASATVAGSGIVLSSTGVVSAIVATADGSGAQQSGANSGAMMLASIDTDTLGTTYSLLHGRIGSPGATNRAYSWVQSSSGYGGRLAPWVNTASDVKETQVAITSTDPFGSRTVFCHELDGTGRHLATGAVCRGSTDRTVSFSTSVDDLRHQVSIGDNLGGGPTTLTIRGSFSGRWTP